MTGIMENTITMKIGGTALNDILNTTQVDSEVYAYHQNNGTGDIESVSATPNVKKIEDNAFDNQTSLKEVMIESPDTVVSRYAFRKCPIENMGFGFFDAQVMDKMLEGVDKEHLTKIFFDENGKRTTIPYRYIAQRAGGIGRSWKIELLKTALERGIELNYESVRLIYKEWHNYQSHDINTVSQVLDKFNDYKTVGVLGIKNEYSDDVKQALEEGFKKRYKMLPKILDGIAVTATALNLSPADVVKAFSIKDTKTFMDKGIPVSHGILAEVAMGDKFMQFIDKPYFATLMIASKEALANPDIKNVCEWIYRHKDTDLNFVIDVLNKRTILKINPEMTVDGVKQTISNLGAYEEIAKLEKKYDGFALSNCKCDIKRTTTVTGKFKCEILDPDDPRSATIGYDTDCCQHLGGAGESAMMYGMVEPNAGFWILSNVNTGEILGQGEVWQTDEDTLVFDNIEFKDDASIRLYKDAIAEWCKASPYKSIYMGTGYNALNELNFDVYSQYNDIELEPLFTGKTISILAQDADDDIEADYDEDDYDGKNAVSIGADDRESLLYSDAMSEVAILKEFGSLSKVFGLDDKTIEKD